MKTFLKIIIGTIVLLWCTQHLTACEDEPSSKPNPQSLIENTWTIGSAGLIKKDGVDVTSEYAGLTITFDKDGTYTATGAKKIFYPSGTWQWQGDGTTEIVLDGSLLISVNELTENTLSVQFDLNEDNVNGGGKTNAVVGTYQILFN